MSFVIASPDSLAAAVTDLTGIGSALEAANLTAAGPTSSVLAARYR
jgi:PE family